MSETLLNTRPSLEKIACHPQRKRTKRLKSKAESGTDRSCSWKPPEQHRLENTLRMTCRSLSWRSWNLLKNTLRIDWAASRFEHATNTMWRRNKTFFSWCESTENQKSFWYESLKNTLRVIFFLRLVRFPTGFLPFCFVKFFFLCFIPLLWCFIPFFSF